MISENVSQILKNPDFRIVRKSGFFHSVAQERTRLASMHHNSSNFISNISCISDHKQNSQMKKLLFEASKKFERFTKYFIGELFTMACQKFFKNAHFDFYRFSSLLEIKKFINLNFDVYVFLSTEGKILKI